MKSRWWDKVAKRFGYVRRPARSASYAAARYTRLEDGWLPSLLSTDQEIKASLRLLRARSRQLVRDNPYAAGFMRLVRLNVGGPHGIRLQSRITKGSGDLRKNTNATIEAAWKDHGRKGVFTLDGRLSRRDAVNLALTQLAEDGEYLILKHRGAPNGHGFAVQFLDPDQLDESYNVTGGPGQPEIRMGVELDGLGAPVAYHIWAGHPSEPMGRRERRRIPASDVLHGFISLRSGQTRGVPWLTPVILRLGMLDGYEEAELVACRSAAKGVFLETMPEFAELWQSLDLKPLEEHYEIPVEPGMATALAPGLRANVVDPTHPTSAYPSATKQFLRGVATGGGCSYNSLTNDLEAVNYSSIRAGLLQERDVWRDLQQWTIEHLMDPIFEEWLPLAALSGAVQLPTPDARRWMAPVWQPRGWAWVDPLNDIEAAGRSIRFGVISRTEICAEQGRDFEEVVQQLAEEQAIAKALGVDIDGEIPEQVQVMEPENDGSSGRGPQQRPREAPDDRDARQAAETTSRTNGNGAHRLAQLKEMLP